MGAETEDRIVIIHQAPHGMRIHLLADALGTLFYRAYLAVSFSFSFSLVTKKKKKKAEIVQNFREEGLY